METQHKTSGGGIPGSILAKLTASKMATAKSRLLQGAPDTEVVLLLNMEGITYKVKAEWAENG